MAKTRSKDHTALDIPALEKEKRELTVKGNDPKRLSQVNEILEYFYFGIQLGKKLNK